MVAGASHEASALRMKTTLFSLQLKIKCLEAITLLMFLFCSSIIFVYCLFSTQKSAINSQQATRETKRKERKGEKATKKVIISLFAQGVWGAGDISQCKTLFQLMTAAKAVI